MEELKLRNKKDCEDIDRVFLVPIVVTIFILFLGGVIFGVVHATEQTPEQVAEWNEGAETFNKLPLETRKSIRKICDSTALDDELMVKLKKESLVQDVLNATWWRGFLLLLLIIVSGATFLDYWEKTQYHLADLPFGCAYGWIIFILILPIGWPFLLISRILIWRYQHRAKIAEREEIKKIAQQESTVTMAQGQLEPSYEDDITPKQFDDHIRNQYVKWRIRNIRRNTDCQITGCEEELATSRRELQHYGEQIKRLQRKVNTNTAALQKLRSMQLNLSNESKTRLDILTEWEQLSNMRGVTKITTPKAECHNKRNPYVQVIIKVRVPYKNNIYDFGDYVLKIYDHYFRMKQIRSGVRLDAQNRIPVYPDQKYDFCFGSRRSEIEHYIQCGRLVEALTLIVDCLHSVNPDHECYIPGCYRKISTIQHYKQRLNKRR